MSHRKAVPCYVPNGGVHNIVNLPLGQFTRLYLKRLVSEMLQNLQTFETMVVAKATPSTIKLLQGLEQLLSVDVKPKANRQRYRALTTANEKNLKPSDARQADEEVINLVDFAVSCGLVALLFLMASHLQYLESFGY